MGGFKGGGPAALAKRNRNDNLPSLIKCIVCLKDKEKHAYGSKQLDDAFRAQTHANAHKPQGRRGAKPPLALRCKQCVGGVKEEMFCVMCARKKDLDDFAKAQRKNSDGAKCNTCMANTLAVEPDDFITKIGHLSDSEDELDSRGYDYFESDERSETTLVSNPWETDFIGDYVTDSSTSGSTFGPSALLASDTVASRITSRPIVPNQSATLTLANVSTLSSRDGRPVVSGSAQTASIQEEEDDELSRGVTRLLVTESDDDEEYDEYGFVKRPGSQQDQDISAWGAFGSNAGNRSQGKQKQPETFNAWGPGGQSAIHQHAPSTSSGTSTPRSGVPPRTTRVNPTSGRSKPSSQFAKVRPENGPDRRERGGLGHPIW